MPRALLLVALSLGPSLAPSLAAAERSFGATVDAGLPDGAGVSLVYRPVSRLRLQWGVTHNMISTGVRVGVSVAPFRSWFTPTLNLDAGRYKEGDANPLLQMASGDPTFHSDSLERVGYDYANAHLGLEFGRKRATFYLHAGASYIATQVHELDNSSQDGSTTVTFTQDPDVRVLTVSARLGLIIYFL